MENAYHKTFLNILYTQNLLTESFSAVLKRYGLSSEQFQVLKILGDQKGEPANMSVIQERMIARTSNSTRLVDKLLLKGLVTREVSSKNRTKVEVGLTKKGLTLLEDMEPAVASHEAQFAHKLSPDELDHLNFLLDKYRTA